MSNPERIKRIGDLFDTMNSNPEDSPEYTKALHELDTILLGTPNPSIPAKEKEHE